jgi:hypothetical protein
LTNETRKLAKPSWQSHAPLPAVLTTEAHKRWIEAEAKWIRAASPSTSEEDSSMGATARWDFLAERLAQERNNQGLSLTEINHQIGKFSRDTGPNGLAAVLRVIFWSVVAVLVLFIGVLFLANARRW